MVLCIIFSRTSLFFDTGNVVVFTICESCKWLTCIHLLCHQFFCMLFYNNNGIWLFFINVLYKCNCTLAEWHAVRIIKELVLLMNIANGFLYCTMQSSWLYLFSFWEIVEWRHSVIDFCHLGFNYAALSNHLWMNNNAKEFHLYVTVPVYCSKLYHL
jgi:hypothetical protein